MAKSTPFYGSGKIALYFHVYVTIEIQRYKKWARKHKHFFDYLEV